VRATLQAKIEFPETGKWVDAAKVEVLPAADPRTHTVTARVYLPDNLPGIIPGMFARTHFVTGKAKKLLVPAAAVLRRGEVTAVYVIDEKNAARLRQVRLSEPLARRATMKCWRASPPAKRSHSIRSRRASWPGRIRNGL
jgi:hypothetical protein